ADTAGELSIEILPPNGFGPEAGVTVKREINQCIIYHRGDRGTEVIMCSLEHGADLLRVGHITAHGQSIFRSIHGCEVFGRLLTMSMIDDDAYHLTNKSFYDML